MPFRDPDQLLGLLDQVNRLRIETEHLIAAEQDRGLSTRWLHAACVNLRREENRLARMIRHLGDAI